MNKSEFGGEYKGVGGSGGVLGLLETIATNFAQMVSETQKIESNSQDEFDKTKTKLLADTKAAESAKRSAESDKNKNAEELTDAKDNLVAA